MRAKIGQLVIVGLEGQRLNEASRRMIEEYKVGGFILFKDNIESAGQTAALLNELKAANKGNAVPLWLSVDQEGGRVSRMPAELHSTPSAKDIASRNDLAYTRGIAEAIGAELKALGFNMDFAPVLDINSNPKNPVIGDRAYGSTPEAVIAHGLESVAGINESGVASVVKHFPGHGDTAVDSHYDLPVVEKTVEQLSQFELLPFAEAIDQDVDAIMVAHLLMRQIDAEHPASISKAVITGLLRDELGYDGVVITDDMTMGALLKGNNIGEAAVQSFLAGTDILLVCHEEELQLEVLQALEQAVDNGTITEQRIDESLRRVLLLKHKYNLSDAAAPPIDLEAVNGIISSALEARP
ncbi:beta-N-acetylhexosaminidase [Paenibacillus sp. SCIV0701]|uniref:Beta-N-acetylhexosaminidase n=1 Tax=Paenibacillus soyae TaxID=2969249 RepID=A0A9X2MUD5_9BACL|nr:beta-N-acetylhexosaminidase [Paenibacillus soyae]MCR2806444.1 beta-N-acetylhexosaminidase [Paenibacillus soyae]